MGVRVAESRITRTKAGAKLVRFSEDVAKARAKVEAYLTGPGNKDDGSLMQTAMADLRMQNEELLVADEELRVQSEELIRTQRRTEVERRRYRDLFDLAPDAHVVTDRHGVIVETNVAGSRLLAVEARFLRGKPLSTFLSSEDSRAFHAALDKLTRQSCIDIDLTVIARGDEAKRTAFRAARMHDPLYYVWSARPMRDMPNDGAAAVAPFGQKRAVGAPINGQSLSGLSQELKRCLQSIVKSTDDLRRSDLSKEERERELQKVETMATKQAAIMETLFDVSSLMARNLTISRISVDLAEVTSLAVASVRAQTARDNIEWKTEIRGPIQIQGDPLRLEQIAINLVGHALPSGPSGAQIGVRLEMVNHAAELSVSNHISDLQSPEMQRIQDWLGRTADDLPDGIGLGLYLVRALTELHGGSVSVRGRGDAGGAAFLVRFPI